MEKCMKGRCTDCNTRTYLYCRENKLIGCLAQNITGLAQALGVEEAK